MQTELLLVVIAKALAELTGMFLLGRGLLYVLAGSRRQGNLFYQIICIVTNPAVRVARWIAPRFVVDMHVPLVAFVLVAWIWMTIVFWILPDMCGSGRFDCSALFDAKTSR